SGLLSLLGHGCLFDVVRAMQFLGRRGWVVSGGLVIQPHLLLFRGEDHVILARAWLAQRVVGAQPSVLEGCGAKASCPWAPTPPWPRPTWPRPLWLTRRTPMLSGKGTTATLLMPSAARARDWERVRAFASPGWYCGLRRYPV